MDDGRLFSIQNLKSFIDLDNKINYNFDDVNATLVSLLEQVMAFIRCEACSILVSSGHSKNLLASLGPGGSQIKSAEINAGSIALWVMEHGQSVLINSPSTDRRFFAGANPKSLPRNLLASPVRFNGDCLGIIEVFNSTGLADFVNDDISMLELLGAHAGATLQKQSMFKKKNELLSLCESPPQGEPFLLGKSSIIREIERTVDEIAGTDTSVLISGESGVGKSVFARRLHLKSERRDRPFVRVNCAFGADSSVDLRTVAGGTVFLDEVGSLPLEDQDQILNLMRDGTFGSPDGIRVVASTRVNLETLVQRGLFREDLCYRLNVLPLNVPPLRKHTEDIIPLAEFFLEKYRRTHKKNVEGFTGGALSFMESYPWPGNVAELRNVVERACMLSVSRLITAEDFSGPNPKVRADVSSSVAARIESAPNLNDRSLRTAVGEFKREYVTKILAEENWNQTAAARTLDVQRTYVSKLIADLGITRDGR